MTNKTTLIDKAHNTLVDNGYAVSRIGEVLYIAMYYQYTNTTDITMLLDYVIDTSLVNIQPYSTSMSTVTAL